MRRAHFFGFIGAFTIGCAFAFVEKLSMSGGIVSGILGAALLAVSFVSRSRTQHHTVTVSLLLGLIFLGGGIGVLRGTQAMSYEVDPELAAHVGESVTLAGTVAEEPVSTEKSQKVIVRVDGDPPTKIITFAPLHPPVSYGDSISLTGILKEPERFSVSDSGRMFNYPRYLAKDAIRYVLERPKLTIVEEGEHSRIKAVFIRLNKIFVRAVERSLSEPHAGLASGVVLGVDGALSRKDEDAFRRAGLVHIVVVSGYNITLVGDAIARLLQTFPTYVAPLGSLLGIVAFIFLTGASQTAIRAGIMAGLVLLARITKRQYDVNRALFLTGFVMVLHQPDILLYDPSFQLSFLATWGLGNLAPRVEPFLSFVPERIGLRDICATTLGTQIAVSPLLLYMSGTLSLVAFPANIIALPVVPLVMIGTLTIGCLGFLPAILSLPFAFITTVASQFLFKVVTLANSVPHSTLNIPIFSVWMLVFSYGFLLYLARKPKPRPSKLYAKGDGASDF